MGSPGEGSRSPDVVLTPAGPGDLGAVRRLLESSGLPVADVGRPGQEFLVARSGGGLVGCVGVELHGDAALLRSLAVATARRGEGLGDRLLRAIVGHARGRGARDLYALTTTIEPLLARRGFTRIDRSEAPPAVRESAEFATLCPGSSACMRLVGELRGPGSG